jgi:hypothetical protein
LDFCLFVWIGFSLARQPGPPDHEDKEDDKHNCASGFFPPGAEGGCRGTFGTGRGTTRLVARQFNAVPAMRARHL